MSLDKIENLLDKNNFDFHFIESVDSTMSEVKKLIYNRNICLMANEQKKDLEDGEQLGKVQKIMSIFLFYLKIYCQ